MSIVTMIIFGFLAFAVAPLGFILGMIGFWAFGGFGAFLGALIGIRIQMQEH